MPYTDNGYNFSATPEEDKVLITVGKRYEGVGDYTWFSYELSARDGTILSFGATEGGQEYGNINQYQNLTGHTAPNLDTLSGLINSVDDYAP